MENIISRLCTLINYLDDCGCLMEEEQADYACIMKDYQEILRSRAEEA